MKLRSTLIIALSEHMQALNLPQLDLAKRFRLTQPRMSDLLTNKVAKFSRDALVEIAAQAGLHVEPRIRNAADTSGPCTHSNCVCIDVEGWTE